MPSKIVLVLIASLFLLSPLYAFGAQSSCSDMIPPGGLYDVIRTWSYSDFKLAEEEYIYQKQYKTHDEAISDGFSLGTVIYGEPLTVGNDFKKEDRDQWNAEYTHRTKRTISDIEKNAYSSLRLNTEAFKDVADCIVKTTAFGLGHSLKILDGCTAIFTSWFSSLLKNRALR